MRSLLPTHYRDKYEILGMADKTHSGLLLCMRHETIGQILDSADSILHFDTVIQISGGVRQLYLAIAPAICKTKAGKQESGC